MGLLRILLFIGIVLLGLIACRQSEPQSMHEGMTAFECKENFASPPACATNFVELIAHRPEFSNKNISLIGYVGQNDGILVVYPSEQAYANRDVSSALNVRGNKSTQVEIMKDCANKYCAISGMFRERGDIDHDQYFGSIWPGKHLVIRARDRRSEPLKMRSEDMDGRMEQ